MKKILSGMFIFLVMWLAIALDSGFSGIIWFWNAPSLILVILIAVPMLIFADCFSDYVRSIKIITGNTEYTTKELKCSLNAVNLMVKLVFVAAVIGLLIGGIAILGSIDDPNAIGPAFAVAILTIFYSFIINIFHYAVAGKIKKELIYREN